MRSVVASKLFVGLSQPELDLLEASSRLVQVAPGEHIFQEGAPGDGIYLVIEGTVSISAMVTPAERRVLSRLQAGDFFGEMAVLDDEPRSASAAAEGTACVAFIPREVLLAMLEKSPILAVNLMREFSRRMRDFNRQYINEVLEAERLGLVGKFARSIVHDFKNPLNVIGIAAEMADMDTATPAARKSSCGRIRKQVDRLNNMISELLEFTRGTQSGVVLAETNFGEFVTDMLAELSGEVSERSVHLVCETSAPYVKMLLDPQRLAHVFLNLVHNAVDAMPEGGSIKVRFRREEGWLVTEIEDTGTGISNEILPRLFEPFATFGKAQGTGLGLSICKRIIEDHRGRLTARNADGGGAIFSFTLPWRS